MASVTDNTSARYYSYRISKAALSMATKNVALEVAPTGVMCIGVEPGWVATGMTAFQWSAGQELPDGLITASESASGLLDVAEQTFMQYGHRQTVLLGRKHHAVLILDCFCAILTFVCACAIRLKPRQIM